MAQRIMLAPFDICTVKLYALNNVTRQKIICAYNVSRETLKITISQNI